MSPLSGIPSHVTSVLEVDLSAIEHNYKTLCHKFSGEKVAAIVKDNAYSLGIEAIAPSLYQAGCRDYFVTTVDGGKTVKSLTKNSNVYVLNGAYEGSEDRLLEHDLVPTLISFSQIDRWSRKAAQVGRKLKALIHFDTGMSRTGLSQEETEQLLTHPQLLQNLDVLYWMSHLACSDKPEHPLNHHQLETFSKITSRLPLAKKSFVNSDGVFLPQTYHCDLARVGLALYGFSAKSEELKPAVAVYAKILQLRAVEAGDTIGYEATYQFSKPSRIATVPVGYAQGWSTTLSNQSYVALKGIKAPIIGRISMDLMGVDVSHFPASDVQENQWVELIGPTISPKELAKAGRTIAYEIILTLRNHYQVYK